MNENNAATMDTASDEISLKELVIKLGEWYRYLLSYWRMIILVAALGAILGLTYAWQQKPVYTAAATYALDDEKTGGGGLSGALGLASSLGIDLGSGGGSVFSASNLMELMHSRKVIELTLLSEVEVEGKKMSLADFYIEVNQLHKKWAAKPELANLSFAVNADRDHFTRFQDSLLGAMAATLDKTQLTISQKDKKVAIGTIEVKSENELFAKLFCENLMKVVTNYYVDTKSKKARNNVALLQKQADSIRGELNNAITGVAAANDQTFNLNPVMSVHKTPAARRQVDVQANTAILTQLVTNLELAKLTLLKETPLIQVIDKPILPLLKEKTSKLKSLILGGFLAGFLLVLFLVFRRLGKELMD